VRHACPFCDDEIDLPDADRKSFACPACGERIRPGDLRGRGDRPRRAGKKSPAGKIVTTAVAVVVGAALLYFCQLRPVHKDFELRVKVKKDGLVRLSVTHEKSYRPSRKRHRERWKVTLSCTIRNVSKTPVTLGTVHFDFVDDEGRKLDSQTFRIQGTRGPRPVLDPGKTFTLGDVREEFQPRIGTMVVTCRVRMEGNAVWKAGGG
jgi:uncharacterized protein affecting Mg2+/Co2+ transport